MKKAILSVVALLVMAAAAYSMVNIQKAGGPREISAISGATSSSGATAN